MKRFAGIFLLSIGCHANGGAIVPRELITLTRAGVAAEVWASRISPCPPLTEDGEGIIRRTGTLNATEGRMTLLACDERVQCCNSFYPDVIYLRGRDSRSYSLRGNLGRLFASNMDCEWNVWNGLFDRMEITVIGRIEGESIHVEQLCR